jgi:hypothetical protein
VCDVWAVIVTFPFRLPVTTPLADTVAALVLELDQMKLWFGTAFPLLSSAVAVSCIVDPAFRFFDGAVIVTVATGEPDDAGGDDAGGDAAGGDAAGGDAAGGGDAGGGDAGGAACAPGLTVIVAMPDFPSAFAATCDVPTASAVTTPSADTLMMLGSCTVQVTAAPGTIAPDPSCTSACKGSRALRAIVELGGLTTIPATSGIASGAVLPHDQLESATMTMVVASVHPLLDMSPLLARASPHQPSGRSTWTVRERCFSAAYGVPKAFQMKRRSPATLHMRCRA